MEFRSLLGAFAKLRKATKLRHDCPSVCPHGSTRFPLEGIALNFIFAYFWKNCRQDSRFITIGQNNEYLLEDQYTFLIISRSFLLRMRNVSEEKL